MDLADALHRQISYIAVPLLGPIGRRTRQVSFPVSAGRASLSCNPPAPVLYWYPYCQVQTDQEVLRLRSACHDAMGVPNLISARPRERRDKRGVIRIKRHFFFRLYYGVYKYSHLWPPGRQWLETKNDTGHTPQEMEQCSLMYGMDLCCLGLLVTQDCQLLFVMTCPISNQL